MTWITGPQNRFSFDTFMLEALEVSYHIKCDAVYYNLYHASETNQSVLCTWYFL